MNEFKNWTEVTTNMYRYTVTAGASYEILVTYQAYETPVGTARANLYFVGYRSLPGSNKFDFSAFNSDLAEELANGPVTFE